MHLSAVQSMIPWCFTYDKLNYAKYLSSYYADMIRLPDTHPSVHTFLENGGFAVQMSASNPFGSIPVDQAMEEIIRVQFEARDCPKILLKCRVQISLSWEVERHGWFICKQYHVSP